MLVNQESSLEDKLVRLTFDVPASLRKSFKLRATAEDMGMKEVFKKLMEAYVSGKIDLKQTK